MRIEVIPNRGPATMSYEIGDGLDWATNVGIATAFTSLSACREIEGQIRDMLHRKPSSKVRVVVGLYQRFTAPSALNKLFALQTEKPNQVEIRIARNRRFHWKLYLFSKGQSMRLYVGSANLTDDGLHASGELSVKISAKRSEVISKVLTREFNSLWGKESFPLTRQFLRNYQKVERPPKRFTPSAQDNKIASLLQKEDRTPRMPSRTARPRIAFVSDDVSKTTAKQVRDNTDWTSKGWDYICYPRKAWFERIRDAGVIVEIIRASYHTFQVQFRRIEDTIQLKTDDGTYFIAHSQIGNGQRRKYSLVKQELKQIGLTWDRIKKDPVLTQEQLKVLCELCHLKKNQVLKTW
ncbi:MAG: phospholipase D family protein [Chloroflexi bacterium]|nr:phospholipase D family protein [Chloroflexota bacterium]